MLKAPPLKSSDLYFLVKKCHCWTYEDNFRPKFKKLSFAILDYKFDPYRPEVCPEIVKLHLLTFLFIFYFFEHINGPLLSLFNRTERCRSEDLRVGAFSKRPMRRILEDRDMKDRGVKTG